MPPGRREQGGGEKRRARSGKVEPASSQPAARTHRPRRAVRADDSSAGRGHRRTDDPTRARGTGKSRRQADDQSRSHATPRAPRRADAAGSATPSPARRAARPQGEPERTHGRRAGRAAATPPGRTPTRKSTSKPRRVADRDTTTTTKSPRTPRALEPPLPDDTDARELDREVSRELRSLPPTLARRVAAHLVAAGHLLDTEPERAHAHAAYAKRLASRVAAVREAAGITAYRVGRYADALADLRAARRMTGRPDHLPVMADCERGLARPERALALARDPQADTLSPAEAAELRIVVSGARRDLGEYGAAVAVFDDEDIHPQSVAPWTVRAWYAYAEALLAAGRREQARRYFAAAAQIDEDGETDAAERLADLGDEPA